MQRIRIKESKKRKAQDTEAGEGDTPQTGKERKLVNDEMTIEEASHRLDTLVIPA